MLSHIIRNNRNICNYCNNRKIRNNRNICNYCNNNRKIRNIRKYLDIIHLHLSISWIAIDAQAPLCLVRPEPAVLQTPRMLWTKGSVRKRVVPPARPAQKLPSVHPKNTYAPSVTPRLPVLATSKFTCAFILARSLLFANIVEDLFPLLVTCQDMRDSATKSRRELLGVGQKLLGAHYLGWHLPEEILPLGMH
jgi:hypothetical protein